MSKEIASSAERTVSPLWYCLVRLRAASIRYRISGDGDVKGRGGPGGGGGGADGEPSEGVVGAVAEWGDRACGGRGGARRGRERLRRRHTGSRARPPKYRG